MVESLELIYSSSAFNFIYPVIKKVEWFEQSRESMSDPNIKVEKEATVIEILSLLHPLAKKNSLRRMVDHGRVLVDGVKISRANIKISPGATLTVLSKSDGDETSGKYKTIIPEHNKRIIRQ